MPTRYIQDCEQMDCQIGDLRGKDPATLAPPSGNLITLCRQAQAYARGSEGSKRLMRNVSI